MTPTDLSEWRARLGLNRSEAARQLDVCRPTYKKYEDGKSPIPRHIALACAAIAHGLPPIGAPKLDKSQELR